MNLLPNLLRQGGCACLGSLFVLGLVFTNAQGDAPVAVQALFPMVEGGEFPKTAITKGPAYQTTIGHDSIDIHFIDRSQSNDYMMLDFGSVDLKDYLAGGYLEMVAEADKPITHFEFYIADIADFWKTRLNPETRLSTLIDAGLHTYRIYLDDVPPLSVADTKHLILMIGDLSGAKGDALGSATIHIRSVSLHPPVPHWQEEKRAVYSEQYHWPAVRPIEPLYYEYFENGVDWDSLASSPLVSSTSLNGPWKKKNFGEKTWDETFLADTRYAQPGFDDSSWQEAAIPEPPTPDQVPGHTWYRKVFTLPNAPQGDYYLRLDDVADDATIYLNGQRVGTQTSTENNFEWLTPKLTNIMSKDLEGASMLTYLQAKFSHEAGGLPFDVSAIPVQADRLYIPNHYGDFPWPLAYRVTPLVKAGANVVAIRTYGDPTRDFWIFHSREDRAAKHVFGLLGNVTLAHIAGPRIGSCKRTAPSKVASDGTAIHRFECRVSDDDAGKVDAVRFDCAGKTHTVPAPKEGKSAVAQFSLPARFTTYQVQVSLLGKDGAVLDQEKLDFHGTVIAVKDGRLWVNGDPFFVRGVNADPGIGFTTDWKISRKEYLRKLDLYQRIGVNAIRSDYLEPWQFDEAFKRGIMVMTLSAIASTEWTLDAFGQLSHPDYRLASDRQRRSVLQIRQCQNILLWDSGNELNTTPGYFDRPIIDAYLPAAYDAIRTNDPDRRPITYSNVTSSHFLKQWNWIFFSGQDAIGLNDYGYAPEFADDIRLYQKFSGGRPLLFTEWGVHVGEKRMGREDAWEQEIKAKWAVVSHTKGVIGEFFYGDPPDVDGARAEAFMRSLYQPYELVRTEKNLRFINRDVAPMRKLEISLKSDANESEIGKADLIRPGEGYDWPLSNATKGPFEIKYETHGGLVHDFTQSL